MRAGQRTGRRARAFCPPLLVVTLATSGPAGAAGALDVLAQETTRAIVSTPPSSLVVAAPLVTDQQAPRGDELVERIAALVAGKLGPGARAHPQPAPLAAARSVAGRAQALVYVRSEISKGDVRATVDVYPTATNAWDRIRNPAAAPVGHAFASAKIDAEVRSFLSPLALEQATVHRARHDEQEVLAAACGDVDGDGGDELVLVSRDRVALGRVRGSEFVVERAVAWSDLSPRLPVAMREPLGGAAITAGTIAVGLTERAAVSLTADFATHTPLFGVPAQAGEGVVCLLPEPSAGAFDGAPFDCAVARDAKPKMAVPAPRFDAFASATVSDGLGSARAVVAVREPSGRLKLKMGDAAPHAPDGLFGAQLAVGDLDQDGTPEVAASAEGAEDAVDVWSWPSESADLRPRLHLPAPAAVRALAICPPEVDGEPVLVAVVGSEVWLIRAAARPLGAREAAAATRNTGP